MNTRYNAEIIISLCVGVVKMKKIIILFMSVGVLSFAQMQNECIVCHVKVLKILETKTQV